MKQYKKLFIAALAVMALGSCSVKEDASPETGRIIRFTTNLGGYVVKATDTEFETGDEVSLFVGDPIAAYNVKMTCRGGELVPEQTIAWPEGTESGVMTAFVAAPWPPAVSLLLSNEQRIQAWLIFFFFLTNY